MQTLDNGIEVPTNSDPYNLTADLANMGDSANVIIPVPSKTARDNLPDKYAGMTVSRTDVPGSPLEIYNGTAWNRQVAPIIRANTQTVGAGMVTDSFTTGLLRPIIQAGTFVGTTSASGDLTITYPTTFPGGVIAGIGFSGDAVYIVSATPTTVAQPTTSSLFLRFAQPNGTALANTTVRGTWIAVGW